MSDEEDELTPFEEEVLGLYDKALDFLADASAAQAWSTPSDMDLDELGEDVMIIAEFGDWVAVNGDLVWAEEGMHPCRFCNATGVRRLYLKGAIEETQCCVCDGKKEYDTPRGTPGGLGDVEIPDTHEHNNRGGRIPCIEEEVSVEHVAGRIYIWMEEESEKYDTNKYTEEDVLKVLRKHKSENDCVYTSVSGDAHYYVKRKPHSEV